MGMDRRRILACAVLLLLVGAAGSHAAPYQLRLANVEELLFFRYVKTQGSPLRAERHVLPELEEILDRARISVHTLLPDREVRSVRPAGGRAEPTDLIVPHITPPHQGAPWMVVDWEGIPGDTVVFEIGSHQASYQELIAVAVNADGVLRRLPVRGIPLFGNRRMHAPSVSSVYLDYIRERGTFLSWVTRYAISRHGLSVVVGRNHDMNFPDTVYVIVKMPPQARTYKVVLAWKDRDEVHQDNDDADDRNR